MIETVKDNLVATYVFIWRLITSYFPVGENVYNQDWDLLIILDACRVDALTELEGEYEFISDVDEMPSVGSTSAEWIQNTFVEDYLDEIRSTSYVTANGFSSDVMESDVDRLRTSETMGTIFENSSVASKLIRNDSVGGEFENFRLVEGSKFKGSNNRSYYHPDIVTARAIETSRQENSNKLIVHYMQPHAPYISEALARGYYKDFEEKPFKYLKNGGELSVVWDSYIDNLRLVLDSLEVLLENVDAETVAITADHGELFGEWGLYSHIYGVPHPVLRKVPWVETTAINNQTVSPEELLSSHNLITDDKKIEDRLSALGYMS